MRYVLAVIGVLFVIGLISGVPFEAMAVIGVFVGLALFGRSGSRRGNRVQHLRRAVFFGGSFIGYRETITDRDPDDPRRIER